MSVYAYAIFGVLSLIGFIVCPHMLGRLIKKAVKDEPFTLERDVLVVFGLCFWAWLFCVFSHLPGN